MTPEEAPPIYNTFGLEGFQMALTDCDFDNWNGIQFAQYFKVDPATISRWRKQVDWEKIKQDRRKRYSAQMTEVDAAMIREAKKGSVEAAKLVYARFDGYIPTSGTIDFSKKSDSELLELAQREKDAILNTRSNQPGTGAAQA